jgi:hypothetical protein
MAYPFAAARGFDGTWWEVSVPDGWSAEQDKTIDGFPYRFSSPAGSFLRLGVRKRVELSGYRDDSVSRQLASEDERRAYLMTKSAAWMAQWTGSPIRNFASSLLRNFRLYPTIRKCNAGWLKGYLVHKGSEDGNTFQGFFAFREWTIYAFFQARKSNFESDSARAIEILETLQFRA